MYSSVDVVDCNLRAGGVQRREMWYAPHHQSHHGLISLVTEVDRIGDRIVKVQVIDYTGKRKKKVTHIEVREAELEEMLKRGENVGMAQFSLF